MHKITILILVFAFNQSYGQKILGEGMINIGFNANTIVNFYDSPDSSATVKVIEFFDDETINSWNIKDLENHRKWTNAIISIDYSIFEFQYTQIVDDYIEIVVNTNTEKKYWIKKTDNIEVMNWLQYLSGMFKIGIKKEFPQKFLLEPNDDAEEFDVTEEYQRCYKVESMKGDWIRISSHGNCEIDDIYESKRKKLPSLWIKWKHNGEIVIDYFHIA